MKPTPFQISRRSFIRRVSATAAATGLPLWFVERELAGAAGNLEAGDISECPPAASP